MLTIKFLTCVLRNKEKRNSQTHAIALSLCPTIRNIRLISCFYAGISLPILVVDKSSQCNVPSFLTRVANTYTYESPADLHSIQGSELLPLNQISTFGSKPSCPEHLGHFGRAACPANLVGPLLSRPDKKLNPAISADWMNSRCHKQ